MSRPKLLDLFCCEGGGAKGYEHAGFDVYGVDLLPRFAKRYPGAGFHAGDVIEVLCVLLAGGAIEFTRRDGTSEWLTLADFAAVHASPPCQRYSITNAARRHDYPDLIGPTRDLLVQTGLPWVIENVVGAPLVDPVSLSWPMFYRPGSVLDDDGTPLTMLRERLFESNLALVSPPARTVPGGAQIAGAYGGARRDKVEARTIRHGGYVPAKHVQERLLGIDWMTQHGLYQSLPPVYTAWIGLQIRQHLMTADRFEVAA